jgi:hypothetical protein
MSAINATENIIRKAVCSALEFDTETCSGIIESAVDFCNGYCEGDFKSIKCGEQLRLQNVDANTQIIFNAVHEKNEFPINCRHVFVTGNDDSKSEILKTLSSSAEYRSAIQQIKAFEKELSKV